MSRVLITAFEPYGPWRSNASWLTLVELTRDFPTAPTVVTRRYPVDFDRVRERLAEDLANGYDYALHLGQAPGATAIRLERIALNVREDNTREEPHPELPASVPCLAADGPLAYRSPLPLERWADCLRQQGIPAQVSHHAGTYVCNATLYWTHYLCERHGWNTKSVFVHLPLDPSQVFEQPGNWASLSAIQSATAVRAMLKMLGHQA